jgi:hypothetical protein
MLQYVYVIAEDLDSIPSDEELGNMMPYERAETLEKMLKEYRKDTAGYFLKKHNGNAELAFSDYANSRRSIKNIDGVIWVIFGLACIDKYNKTNTDKVHLYAMSGEYDKSIYLNTGIAFSLWGLFSRFHPSKPERKLKEIQAITDPNEKASESSIALEKYRGKRYSGFIMRFSNILMLISYIVLF